MARERIRIGCGAGFADDRIPPGVDIVERGELDYLAMECLAERTIARETLDRAKDPAKGYTPVLLERMEAIMPPALQRGIKIVTNMGAANPMGAAVRNAFASAVGAGRGEDYVPMLSDFVAEANGVSLTPPAK